MAVRRVNPRPTPTMQEIDDGWILAAEPIRSAPARTGVDLNHASLRELTALPGIGVKLAKRIIGARPFNEVDELASVPRLRRNVLDGVRNLVYVG